MSDCNNDCENCKIEEFCGYSVDTLGYAEFSKVVEEHDAKIRAEVVEEAAVLIRKFTREWNMTNHKRISYIASDELISYLRNHMKEQSNAK